MMHITNIRFGTRRVSRLLSSLETSESAIPKREYRRFLQSSENNWKAPSSYKASICSPNSRFMSHDAGTTKEYGKDYTNIVLTRPCNHVMHLQLNRPRVKNAFSLDSAKEYIEALDFIEEDPTVRCLVLSGCGPDFTSGVDIKNFMTTHAKLQEVDDVSRKAKVLLSMINKFQSPFKRMDAFGKPIISLQHGLCYGLGMELAACTDIRYCSSDTRYSVREVLIGIAADVGSLQKMPRLVNNQSVLRELVYSGREMDAKEALAIGFVSKIFDSKDAAMEAALKVASTISRRSPVAVQGSKRNLKFSEDKSFDVGLDYNAVWNMSMMQSEDVVKAVASIMSKSKEDDNDFADY